MALVIFECASAIDWTRIGRTVWQIYKHFAFIGFEWAMTFFTFHSLDDTPLRGPIQIEDWE